MFLVAMLCLSASAALVMPSHPAVSQAVSVKSFTALGVSTMAVISSVDSSSVYPGARRQGDDTADFEVPSSQLLLREMDVPKHARPSVQDVENVKRMSSLEMAVLRLALLGSTVLFVNEVISGLSSSEQLSVAVHLFS